jgi:hypothetical protein
LPILRRTLTDFGVEKIFESTLSGRRERFVEALHSTAYQKLLIFNLNNFTI